MHCDVIVQIRIYIASFVNLHINIYVSGKYQLVFTKLYLTINNHLYVMVFFRVTIGYFAARSNRMTLKLKYFRKKSLTISEDVSINSDETQTTEINGSRNNVIRHSLREKLQLNSNNSLPKIKHSV